MVLKQFNKKHIKICKKFNVVWVPNNENYTKITAALYFDNSNEGDPKKDDFIIAMKGFIYNRQGQPDFNFKNYLLLLERTLADHFRTKLKKV